MLAAYLWDWVDLGVIVGLLLLNAIIGFTQDYTAGSIVKACGSFLQELDEYIPFPR